jgi:hypothetical protein
VNWRSLALTSILLLPSGALAACGSSGGGTSAQTTTTTSTTTAASGTSSEGTTTGGDALVAEAQQTAAGDIPDNQVFLRFHDSVDGYSIKYPEGWAQRRSAGVVTFRDKNNLVRIEVVKGSGATVAGARADLARLRGRTPSLRF